MCKKLMVLVLSVAMVLSVVAIPAAATGQVQRFTDVPADHWAATYINEAVESGLMSGYGYGRFGPDDLLKIDQLATIISNAMGHDTRTEDGYWAYGAVEYCLSGVGCLSFDTITIDAQTYGMPCTRELAFSTLMRLPGLKSITSLDGHLVLEDIPDYISITPNMRPLILEAYNRGLTSGVDKNGTFRPKDYLTRAEMAAMIIRFGLDKIQDWPTPFSDVRAKHPYAAHIEDVYYGGLMPGYSDGTFRPDEVITVGEMAALICDAVGHEYQGANGYERYGAVEYCTKKVKSLNKFGEITAENYEVPCSRNIGYNLFYWCCGVRPGGRRHTSFNKFNMPAITGQSLPDTECLQRGIAVPDSVDNDGTINFDGSLSLTRGEAAAIFSRAGWAKAATKATTGEGLTNQQLYEAIKDMGVEWKETDGLLGGKVLTAVDPKYCGLQVNSDGNRLWLILKEDGKESFGLTPRRLIKDILDIVLPTESAEAYNAMKSCFLQQSHDGGSSYPNAIRWLDNRCFKVNLSSPAMTLAINFNELNDIDAYEASMSAKKPVALLSYPYIAGSDKEAIAIYELDKW